MQSRVHRQAGSWRPEFVSGWSDRQLQNVSGQPVNTIDKSKLTLGYLDTECAGMTVLRQNQSRSSKGGIDPVASRNFLGNVGGLHSF